MDEKSLLDMRKGQITVEFGCRPDFADFDPAVIRGCAVDKIGILPVFKIKRDILKKSGLIVFDGEMIMSIALIDQIIGYLVLGQQGIGGNVFTLNIDGLE